MIYYKIPEYLLLDSGKCPQCRTLSLSTTHRSLGIFRRRNCVSVLKGSLQFTPTMFICSVTAGLDFGWVAVPENSLAMMLMCEDVMISYTSMI